MMLISWVRIKQIKRQTTSTLLCRKMCQTLNIKHHTWTKPKRERERERERERIYKFVCETVHKNRKREIVK